ncbi:hypothetical protein O1611_g3759 [Lasiodiplodia mahajangana]|uniref:Uncharacterized protein n=1 Tax=Lasiodiplodia mahajangana TaxID=1108764 RepID=A0ACC2JRJ2_9PEZI|nr:hypothetical protein O1611_g3759 [Lasiodiplodia mahajangana]
MSPLKAVLKALRLFTVTHTEETLMRVAHHGLEPEEATTAADAMYNVIQDEYEWSWPDQAKFLKKWKDDRPECVRDPERDTDEVFERRRMTWRAWPELKTRRQAEWIRCALIASCALDYLHKAQSAGGVIKTDDRPPPNVYYASFDPAYFYQYVVICLTQGLGTALWKKQRPMPAKDEANPGAWFVETTRELVTKTIKEWEQGIDLEKEFPVMTLEESGWNRGTVKKVDEEAVKKIRESIERARKILEADGSPEKKPHVSTLVGDQARRPEGSSPARSIPEKDAGVKSRKRRAEQSGDGVSERVSKRKI